MNRVNSRNGCGHLSNFISSPSDRKKKKKKKIKQLYNTTQLECGPMPNLMVAMPNVAGALCSTPQSLADAHY